MHQSLIMTVQIYVHMTTNRSTKYNIIQKALRLHKMMYLNYGNINCHALDFLFCFVTCHSGALPELFKINCVVHVHACEHYAINAHVEQFTTVITMVVYVLIIQALAKQK